MSENDKAFYRRRAEEELAHAQCSTDELLVSFHSRLADFYLGLVFGKAVGPNAEARAAH